MQPEELLEALEAGHLIQHTEAQAANQAKFPYRGSALGGCMRRLALAATDPLQDVPSLKSIRAMDTGTDAGIRNATALSKAYGDAFAAEVPLYVPIPLFNEGARLVSAKYTAAFPEDSDGEGLPSMMYPMPGDMGEIGVLTHLDGAITHGDGSVTLIEFKTKHPWGCKKLRTEGIGKDYLAQVLGGELALIHAGADVRGSLICFEAKDSHQQIILDPREDPLYTPTFLKNCLTDVAMSMMMWASGTPDAIPEIEHQADKLDWHCNYCPIGPIRGRCFEHLELVNKASDSQTPNWRIR